MSKLSENILGQIKEQGIKPRPRWYFVLMNVLLVASLLLAVVVGGLMSGMVLLKMSNFEWGFLRMMADGRGPAFWELLPFMWLVLLGVVVFVASRVFGMIEGVYKYSHWLVLAGTVVLSLIIGGLFYSIRLADAVEISLRRNIPPYEQMERMMERKWNIPERGLLPGRVIEIKKGGFTLEDLQDKNWEVEAMDELMGRVKLENGQMIMVIGEQIDENHFRAKDLREKRAFGVHKMMMQRMPRMMESPNFFP